MTTIVIMPGGFHPYHAGHHALYQSAQRTFPDAEVYVAATNDTSSRPFPFAVKEKLAKLAGVDAGHFVQVKSPFRAEEITSKFDPQKDVLIFVRSEKDAKSPPQPGGVKKDGSPSYLQPLLDAQKLEPFAKHAYMAYLPTVEFGPGMTSATQIRSAWPTLNEKRKTALVMSLYPKTQTNPKLAQTVVKLLDAAIGGQDVAEGLDEAVGDNYLYHATQPSGMMRILRSGAIKASYRPQEATKARTQSPTVSTTRSKQYAESDDFVNFLNLTKEGNSVIIVFDRSAVANHYKMFSTSQGTQTVGDEFEEVIVVPKGAMPIQGTMKGFYFNPKRTVEIEEFKDTPWFKELLNSPYYMGQKPGVAEGNDDHIWGAQGNFAGDKPFDLGGAVSKRLDVDDTVSYFGEKATILAMSKDRTVSRIHLKRGVTQNVRTSDLKRVEQGVAEGAPIVVAQAPIHIRNPKKAPQPYRNQGDIVPDTKPPSTEKRGVKGRPGQRPMPQHNENNDYLDE